MRIRLQPPRLGILLLIEFKKSFKHDWVFHTQEKEKELLPLLGTLVDFLKKIKGIPFPDKLVNLTPTDVMAKLSGLHLLDMATKIGVINIVPSSKDRDDFYVAINEILSALGSMRERMKPFVVFPVIVFDGDIFEFYQENNETKIQPINHLQFMSFEKAQAGMLPCLVDVIRKTYFSEFLRMIERDFYVFTQLINMKGVEP